MSRDDWKYAAGHTLGGVHPHDCYQGPPEDNDSDVGDVVWERPYNVLVREIRWYVVSVEARDEKSARTLALEQVVEDAESANAEDIVGSFGIGENGVTEGREDE